MSLGSNIRRLREAHGMNQEDLAKAVGVSPASISFWESDTKVPRMGAIEKMAKLFGVLKSEIIEGSLTDGRTLFNLYNRLNPEDKAQAESYIRFLVQKELKDNPK